MDIVTWDPKDSDKVEERYENWEYPEGIKVVSEWLDLTSCRYFVVYDAENTEAYAASILPWRDICLHESFPVMEARELMKFTAERMG